MIYFIQKIKIFLLGYILLLFLSACSSDEKEEKEILYDFPPLSLSALTALNTMSESMEGFFVTTDLSDWDKSYADRGFYLYVCIRFLNDPTVQGKLNKSAIPLLIQASNDKDQPEAEAVLLLHPKTKKPGGDFWFYHEEGQKFALAGSPLSIKEQEHLVLDVGFNSESRLMEVSFLKKDVSLKLLDRPVAPDPEEEEESVDTEEGDNIDEETKKDWVLKVGSFAKQFSSSCENWPVLNYTPSQEFPDYVKSGEGEGAEGSADGGSNAKEGSSKKEGSGTNSASLGPLSVPKQTLIPESAPYVPVAKVATS